MKNMISLFTVLFLVLTAVSYSQEFAQYNPSSAKYRQIEQNYLKGLNSDVVNLKISCAYFLGEMKSEKAIIPLMKMFRNTSNETERLVAAWSLLKIGNPRSVFFVKRAIDLGEKSAPILSYFYNNYEQQIEAKIANK